MPLYSLDGIAPQFEDRDSVFVAPDAAVVGNVHVGKDVSIWFGVAIRGDNERITIGSSSNVQEHTVMHTDPGFKLTIGENCTIGHRAMLHGCTIGDNSLVGMGAIILNGAKIGNNCLVGAGALVTEGKEFPDNSLIVGSPAKAVRELTEEQAARLKMSAKHYVANGRRFAKGLKEI
ncbi:MAG: gamma carbonic anhydrase family protein [Mesorhizobium sp.]